MDENTVMPSIKCSGQINELAAALAKAQEEMKNPKNSATNPFFKSKYATLGDTLDLMRPVLGKHGLSFLQPVGLKDGYVTVKTILMHSSGQWLESDSITLPVMGDRGVNPAQAAGICMTYGRRYSLSALIGVAGEEDNDGNTPEQSRTGDNKAPDGTPVKDVANEAEGQTNEPAEVYICQGKPCEGKNKTIPANVAKFSKDKHGKELCMSCQKKAKAGEEV